MSLPSLGRILTLVAAGVVVLLCLGCAFGVWWASGVAWNTTSAGVALLQGGVVMIDSAVNRAGAMLQTARSEVQRAAEEVDSIAADPTQSRPVLVAISERLESRLQPQVDGIPSVLSTLREALISITVVVRFTNSLPFFHERAPRLEKLDEALGRLEALEVHRLKSEFLAAAEEMADPLTHMAATALAERASLIDSGLGDLQARISELQAEVQTLEVRALSLLPRLQLISALSATLVTLLCLWIVYSQVVLIRHRWHCVGRAQGPGTSLPRQSA